MVKIFGISGSPRDAATVYALKQALEAAEEVEGVKASFYSLKGRKLNYCIHCDRCVKEGSNRCVVYKNDDMNELYDPFYEADGYIIASPVYEMAVTAQLATFFNRFRCTYPILKNNPDYFTTKVGGAIAVGGTRNGGQESTINNILGFYHTQGIIVVSGGLGLYNGASLWSKDQKAQGAKDDTAGIANARTLGRRVANTAVLIKKGLGAL